MLPDTDCLAREAAPGLSLHEEERPSLDLWHWALRFALTLGLVGLFYLALTGPAFRFALDSLGRSRWYRIFVYPSFIWGGIGLVMLAFRTLLWFRYHPFRPEAPSTAPFMTVVIPAYNEGPMVAQSIDSVAEARYPAERLEILVVDDGSRDDTWEHIQIAARRHPGLVTAIRFPANRGKRAALEAGFLRARGEILVTIDSDSRIEPQTLLAIAGPFRDPAVGGVAGKVAVNNRDEGLLPRMLHVRFILSFDFIRAAQSTYRTVFCCPGALSAYRASVVKRVLEPWMNQTFLGEACTYGEDRAMTNFILGQGYDVVYQRTAVVHTNVPSTYGRLCKMYLRWDRSFIKEELHLARIVWRRPLVPRLITILESALANLRFPVTLLSLGLLGLLVAYHPYMLVRLMFAIGATALLNTLYFLHSERSMDFVYGVLYAYFAFFGLFWIFPTAFFTVRSRSWMTR